MFIIPRGNYIYRSLQWRNNCTNSDYFAVSNYNEAVITEFAQSLTHPTRPFSEVKRVFKLSNWSLLSQKPVIDFLFCMY